MATIIRNRDARRACEEGLLKVNPCLSRGAGNHPGARHAIGRLRRTLHLGLLATLAVGLSAATAGAAFQNLELDPRLRAMGGAGTAEGSDYLALYHNPASLSLTDAMDLGVSYSEPYQQSFLKLWAAGISAKLPGKLGGVGFGFRRFGTDYLDQSLSEENTFSVAHGFSLYHDVSSTVSVGYALNLFSLKYGPTVTGVDPGSATSVGIDLSARVTLHNRTAFGFLAQNINNPTIGDADVEDLPRRLIGGVSYSPYPGVITNFDLDSVLGEQFRFRGGTEFSLNDYFDLRFGIVTDPNIYSAGFGLNWKGLRVDYGFSSGAGPLQESHQVGLSVTPSAFNSNAGEE